MVQEQINKIKTETINNDKIQKAVIDFMEQQSKVPICYSENKNVMTINNKMTINIIESTAELKYSQLLILIYGASKQVIRCYHSNEFVRKYSRFSEVIAPYVSL